MKKILLASATAVALVAGVGAANAQMSEYRNFNDGYGPNNAATWNRSGDMWSERRGGGMYGPVGAYGPTGMYGSAYAPAAGPTTYGYAFGPGVSVD